MKHEGPSLEELTRRLGDCPPVFLSQPHREKKGGIHVDAVVSDLMHDLGRPPLSQVQARSFLMSSKRFDRNRGRLILICSWLLHYPWFRSSREHTGNALAFLARGLDELARVVEASRFHEEPERREELVRLTLSALDLRPEGESIEMALDRLSTVNSVERQRLVRESTNKQKRILEIMKKKAQQQAAAKVSRE